MNRQHISLTEAQIIATEKGELQLEYRNGEKVCQLFWFKPPYSQDSMCIWTINQNGNAISHLFSGVSSYGEHYDIFISELAEPDQVSPKPLYEVGEIIEMSRNGETWFDVEYFVTSKCFVFGWLIFEDENKNGIYHYCNKHHRKKQIEKTVTLENKVMTVKEALKYLTNL